MTSKAFERPPSRRVVDGILLDTPAVADGRGIDRIRNSGTAAAPWKELPVKVGCWGNHVVLTIDRCGGYRRSSPDRERATYLPHIRTPPIVFGIDEGVVCSSRPIYVSRTLKGAIQMIIPIAIVTEFDVTPSY